MRSHIRRFLSLALVLCLLLGCLPAVSAATATGKLPNSDISWRFDASSGLLTVSGSGPMPNDGDMPDWLCYDAQIRTVVVEDGITTVCPFAFYKCENLTSVSLPDTVTEILHDAFHSCRALPAIRLPSHLTGISVDAFMYCESLTAIDIPGTVTSLCGRIFAGCTSLRSVTLHSGLEIVGNYAFAGLPVEKIVLPGTLTEIREYAFEGSAIREIDIPGSVKSIGYRAFCSCCYLLKVTVHSGMDSISGEAFLNTPVKTFIIRSKYCTLGDYSFGQNAAAVYGYPGSTAQKLIEGREDSPYTFHPLYFDDVAPGVWYFDNVAYVKEQGLFSGTAERTFAPESPMTRAMVVQVLYNDAGDKAVYENPFSDVADDAWYAPAVCWAAAQDVVNGVGDGRFDPDGKVTREQLASILFRLYARQGGDVSRKTDLAEFHDTAAISDWAQNSIGWAVAQGILTGASSYGILYLQPKATATRAQVAAIMQRYKENLDAVTHTDLSFGAEAAVMPALQEAAARFTERDPSIRIHLYEEDYLIALNRGKPLDAVFVLGEESKRKIAQANAYPGTTPVPALFSPYTFVASWGNPANLQGLDDMIARLKSGELRFALGPASSALGQFGLRFLQSNGIPAEAGAEAYTTHGNVVRLMEEICSCGAVLTADAIRCRQTQQIMPYACPDGEALYCFVPDAGEKKEAIEKFLQFLDENGNREYFAEYGLYRLPDTARAQ